MKEYFGSKKSGWILLFAIIVATQCIVTAIMFANNKQDYHSDEYWNYGFANSSDGMHIYKNKEATELRYLNEWTDASVFRDYLTVSEDEIFDYVSPYRNSTKDLNPFLGYYFLHFICSFFPGVYSPWFAFVLNIICFVITQIFLYKLIKSSTDNNVVAMIAVAFLGFSSGMRDVTVFLRIYAPAVMFTTMVAYYMQVIFKNRDEKVSKSTYIKLFLSAVAASLTLHAFLVVAFAMTALYCLYYLCTKRFKKMFALGLVMAGAVLASMLIFPSTFAHLFGDKAVEQGMSGALPFNLQFKAYFYYLTNDFFGIHTSAWATMTPVYISYGILLILFFTIPTCFILRNETYFKNFVKKIKEELISWWHKIKNFQFDIIVMTGAILFLFAICGFRTSVYFMGRLSSRYIFIVYPIFVAILTEILYHFGRLIFKDKVKKLIIIISCLAVIFTVLNNVLSKHTFFLECTRTGMTIEEMEENANVIVLMDEIVRMTAVTGRLMNVDKFYYVTYDSALKQSYEMTAEVDTKAPLYLLIDDEQMVMLSELKFEDELSEKNFWNMFNAGMYYDKEKYLDFFKKLPITEKLEYMGKEVIFGRGISIYKLN